MQAIRLDRIICNYKKKILQVADVIMLKYNRLKLNRREILDKYRKLVRLVFIRKYFFSKISKNTEEICYHLMKKFWKQKVNIRYKYISNIIVWF